MGEEEKENCDICEFPYKKQVWESGDGDSCYISQPCPKCGYTPAIQEEIYKILGHIEIKITCRRNEKPKIGLGTEELEKGLLEIIKGYWPKPKPEERKR